MNFSAEVKKEIINRPCKDDCCKTAFLAGLIRGSGAIIEQNGEIGFEFSTEFEEILNLATSYFYELFKVEIRDVSVEEDKLNKLDRFTLSMTGERAVTVLKALYIVREIHGEIEVNLKFNDLLEKECCMRSFLRGLFIGTGSLTVPKKSGEKNGTGYHLELVFSHYTPALETNALLSKFSIIGKIMRRKESYVVYIKSAEDIKDFIALVNAPKCVLKMTDLMIEREMANKSNRQKNCDLGNVNRQVEATEKQLFAIDKIEKCVGLSSLGDSLKETAVARKNYPEETLSELADRLNITKSCLNHRLRKIIAIAENTL